MRPKPVSVSSNTKRTQLDAPVAGDRLRRRTLSHGRRCWDRAAWLRGGNLRERITRQGGQQTREEILEWLPTMAGALDTVHRNGSLHRDVKPANILFDGEGHAVLSDFGIATAIGLRIMGKAGLFEMKKLSVLQVLPLAACYALCTPLSNLSLAFNSVGFYQMMKILTTPYVAVIHQAVC